MLLENNRLDQLFHGLLFFCLQNCQIYLCGTKYDLIEENSELRKIDDKETKALALGTEYWYDSYLHILYSFEEYFYRSYNRCGNNNR